MMGELLRRRIRLIEARFTPRAARVTFAGMEFRLAKSLWWDDTSQSIFESEISPYFSVLGCSKSFGAIVDAGGATGQFSVVAAKLFPGSVVHAFEPSERQRIMLQRNIKLNGLKNVRVHSVGLWNEPTTLSFRTHGSISSVENVGTLPSNLAFEERIPVTTLDTWAVEHRISNIGLIKMDIEGAEIEALEGSKRVLSEWRPELLVQAYHVREGSRTFERCAAFLKQFGYLIREAGDNTGFLHAVVSRP
jgi:FkbM family methyltransferase